MLNQGTRVQQPRSVLGWCAKVRRRRRDQQGYFSWRTFQVTEIARSKPFDAPFGRLIGCLPGMNCGWRLRFGFVIVLVLLGTVAWP